MSPNRLPFLMFMFMALVLVVLIGLFTGSWVAFGIALAVHLIASAIVLTGAFRSARAGDEADESSERLERAGKEAAGSDRATLEDELEALKHQPPSHPAGDRQ